MFFTKFAGCIDITLVVVVEGWLVHYFGTTDEEQLAQDDNEQKPKHHKNQLVARFDVHGCQHVEKGQEEGEHKHGVCLLLCGYER